MKGGLALIAVSALIYLTSALPAGNSVCDLKYDTGDSTCTKNEKRWAKAPAPNGYCFSFTYSGCGGNGNNFKSEQECLLTCVASIQNNRRPFQQRSMPTKAVCALPKVTGPCRASKLRYALVNGVCESFIYGGCKGNSNNFRTLEQCKETCSEHAEVESIQTRSFNSWCSYYEGQPMQCPGIFSATVSFINGQCQQNGNPSLCFHQPNVFMSYEECQQNCY